MSLVDTSIFIICGLSTLIGYLSGLIKSFFSIASYFIAIYIAKMYYTSFALYMLANTSIGTSINNFISEKSPLDIEVISMGNYSLNSATLSIVNVISMILLFFMLKIALSIIVTILNGVFSLPLLNGLNKLGGGIFGFIRGVFIICIIFAIIVPLNINKNTLIEKEIYKSKIGILLYNNNPIIKIMEGDD